MGYSELDKRTREVAEAVLTQKQLDVFKLWMNGASTSRIGFMLEIAEPVARRTRDRAVQKVSIELAKPSTKDCVRASIRNKLVEAGNTMRALQALPIEEQNVVSLCYGISCVGSMEIHTDDQAAEVLMLTATEVTRLREQALKRLEALADLSRLAKA